jgi:uncharacterized protein (TIGR03067 family)
MAIGFQVLASLIAWHSPWLRSQPVGDSSGDALALIGIWEVTALEAGGRPESDKNFRWTTFVFTRDKLILREGYNPPIEFAYQLNPDTVPKTIDLSIRGYTARGIYKLEGDELVLCLSMGGPRPVNFTTRGRNDTEMFTLRRSLWERFSEPTLGFTVEAPGSWHRQTATLELPQGNAPVVLYQTEAPRERLRFTIGVVSLPARANAKTLDTLFQQAQLFLQKPIGTHTITEETKLKASGSWPTRELTLRSPENKDTLMRARLLLIGDRLFMLAVSGPEENARTAALRFWATFRPTTTDTKKTESHPR